MDAAALLAEQREADAARDALVHPARDEEYTVDPGGMAVFDPRPIERATDKVLRNTARDNTQLLLNSIWDLPVHREDDVIVATIPKPKAPTRWEKFAKAKGIQNRKRTRMVFDEETQEYKPRFGYKSKNWEKDHVPWIEVKGNEDPYEDPFERRAAEKKLRVARNEAQRIRNLTEARLSTGGDKSAKSALKAARAILALPKDVPTEQNVKAKALMKKTLDQALTVSKTATASVGKFDKGLPNEPKSALRAVTKEGSKRRAVAGNFDSEKDQALKLLEKMGRKKGVTIATKTGFKDADAPVASMSSSGKVRKQGKKRPSKQPKGGKGKRK